MGGAAGAVLDDQLELLSEPRDLDVLDEFVLVRAAAKGGATRSDLTRDLGGLVSHRLSPSEQRRGLDSAVAELDQRGLIAGKRGRFQVTEAGLQRAREMYGVRKWPDGWSDIRDGILVAHALGLSAEPARLKTLARPDGLRASILQKTYAVGGRRVVSSARLRMALAVVALERAFGNKIKTGLDAGRALSVKASRLLAGQLAARPRDFGTDARLIAALAAEAVGSVQVDAASLRTALLRRYYDEKTSGKAEIQRPEESRAEPPRRSSPEPLASADRTKPAAASRPDLAGFAAEVLRLAAERAEGWPGNRKAFIADVWEQVAAAHPEWGLSEIEFKVMLTEAHRTGHIVLANADIRNKANLQALQASAITYKNTVWHFVRVET